MRGKTGRHGPPREASAGVGMRADAQADAAEASVRTLAPRSDVQALAVPLSLRRLATRQGERERVRGFVHAYRAYRLEDTLLT
jgi:hypothetical protein